MSPRTTKTTVYLDGESYRQLQAMASQTGRPTAALIREAIAEYAAARGKTLMPRSLGAGRSSRSNLGSKAEDMLTGMGRSE